MFSVKQHSGGRSWRRGDEGFIGSVTNRVPGQKQRDPVSVSQQGVRCSEGLGEGVGDST